MNNLLNEQEVAVKILKKHIKPDSKRKDTKFTSRLLPAAVGGLVSAAATVGASMATKKFLGFKLPKHVLPIATLSGTSIGFFRPDMYNAIWDEQHKKISPKQAKKILSNVSHTQEKVISGGTDVYDTYSELSKKANLVVGGLKVLKAMGTAGKDIGKGISVAGKSVQTGGQLFMQGLKPVKKTIPSKNWFTGEIRKNPKTGEIIKKAPIGALAFGTATKAVTAGGLYAGGKAVANAIQAPRSASNYTTSLRNNVLAGNIKPNELTSTETRGVQALGMR